MTNVMIRVTLKNGSLEVDESEGVNEICKGETTITWRLRRSCAGHGSFNPIDNCDHPGFAWGVPTPPGGVFDHPRLEEPGNKITIQDHHVKANSAGEFPYRLCAKINGKLYVSHVRTSSNPKIKNV